MPTLEEINLIEDYLVSASRESLYAYRQYLHGANFKKGWFPRVVSHALQKFYEDYKAKKRPTLIIEAPPQHGKSEAVSDAINWIIGKDPSLRMIYASFSGRLGVRTNLKIQRTLDSEKYQKVYSDTAIGVSGHNESQNLQRSKEFIELGGGGSFRNTTVNGAITGESLDIGFIDDPIKGREAANSPTIRDKTWDWFTDDFGTRFDEYAGMVIILTRWHRDDVVGRLLDKDPDSITHLRFPAIATEDEEYRKEGEPLFPEHKSLEFLMSRKHRMAESSWESLYQQNPVIEGGNLFKDEWWRYYSALPKILYRTIYADTAQKASEENDYSVFQVWGKSYDGNAYLIDMIRGKWEAPELLRRAKSFWQKHRANEVGIGSLRAMKIEDKSSGTGLIQQLKNETNIPVIGIPRSRGSDKVTRAHDVAPMIESGRVFLPEDADFLSDFILEATAFPASVNDDQIDPMMDAIQDMLIDSVGDDFGAIL